ncbi:uncharacterized protein [Nicotiana tomentosiformis]|uniref:uncharacterized protein n=1 Tax=Nicotiana tomentosiformis TaxID=4098 RepID=UPI00388CAC68
MAKETGDDIYFQRFIEIARRIDMVRGQERGAISNKRPRHSDSFSGALSGGRDSFGRGYLPRPFQSALQASHVMPRDSSSAPIYVSIPVKDSIVVDRVYCSCVISIGSLETSVDLLLLDMVDFAVILGMDWVSPYHAILDRHAKMVTLAMPKYPLLEWRETPGYSTSRVISYVKARHMVEKGYLAYLAYIHDYSVEVPSMDSVPVACEFPYVFSPDLPGTPPDRDIDFCIDLALGTQPISIPPYRMAPTSVEGKRNNYKICMIRDSLDLVCCLGCTSVVHEEERWYDEEVY